MYLIQNYDRTTKDSSSLKGNKRSWYQQQGPLFMTIISYNFWLAKKMENKK